MTTGIKITRTINVNGKQYNSLDDLPPEIRQAAEQQMASGSKQVTINRITINGQEYEGTDCVPAEYRGLLEDAVKVPRSSSLVQRITVVLIVLAMLVYIWLRSR